MFSSKEKTSQVEDHFPVYEKVAKKINIETPGVLIIDGVYLTNIAAYEHHQNNQTQLHHVLKQLKEMLNIRTVHITSFPTNFKKIEAIDEDPYSVKGYLFNTYNRDSLASHLGASIHLLNGVSFNYYRENNSALLAALCMKHANAPVYVLTLEPTITHAFRFMQNPNILAYEYTTKNEEIISVDNMFTSNTNSIIYFNNLEKMKNNGITYENLCRYFEEIPENIVTEKE